MNNFFKNCKKIIIIFIDLIYIIKNICITSLILIYYMTQLKSINHRFKRIDIILLKISFIHFHLVKKRIRSLIKLIETIKLMITNLIKNS